MRSFLIVSLLKLHLRNPRRWSIDIQCLPSTIFQRFLSVMPQCLKALFYSEPFPLDSWHLANCHISMLFQRYAIPSTSRFIPGIKGSRLSDYVPQCLPGTIPSTYRPILGIWQLVATLDQSYPIAVSTDPDSDSDSSLKSSDSSAFLADPR
jgi:hypothetical protein